MMLPMALETGYKAEANELGAMGEAFARLYFTLCGYAILPKKPKNGDTRIVCPITGVILNVEVKTAQMRKDFKYGFHISDPKRGDYRDSDYLLLICVSRAGNITLYSVPCKEIVGQRTVTIPHIKHLDKYKGRWAKYLIRRLPVDLAFI